MNSHCHQTCNTSSKNAARPIVDNTNPAVTRILRKTPQRAAMPKVKAKRLKKSQRAKDKLSPTVERKNDAGTVAELSLLLQITGIQLNPLHNFPRDVVSLKAGRIEKPALGST